MKKKAKRFKFEEVEITIRDFNYVLSRRPKPAFYGERYYSYLDIKNPKCQLSFAIDKLENLGLYGEDDYVISKRIQSMHSNDKDATYSAVEYTDGIGYVRITSWDEQEVMFCFLKQVCSEYLYMFTISGASSDETVLLSTGLHIMVDNTNVSQC